MQSDYPENFRLDFAVSREQTNASGEKMYIQTRMAEYAEELWELLKKDNTFIYMCGLKGMEKGIDGIMESLAERDGKPNLHFKVTNNVFLNYYTILPLFRSRMYCVVNHILTSCISTGYVWADYKKQLKKNEQWNVEVY